ncbi:MAG: hypothetical protein IPI64_00630 [Chloracidobacterium sp.]|nr:hypothetical protein [Chloracidobacterium sp.]
MPYPEFAKIVPLRMVAIWAHCLCATTDTKMSAADARFYRRSLMVAT